MKTVILQRTSAPSLATAVSSMLPMHPRAMAPAVPMAPAVSAERLDAVIALNACAVNAYVGDSVVGSDLGGRETTISIKPTTKQTWTTTPATLFGTHRQRPKESIL